ncbi:MAG TPA: hypothetical protein DCS83_04035 [Prevotella sp.]|nr:hypothetical protein [Prevotella sp.]
MKKYLFLLLMLLATIYSSAQNKREFRGAWIQCVNGQFQGLSTQEIQANLIYQLDQLQRDGINAVIFQVRPECDALYASKYEPWSRFLTGIQGQAPAPYWDPLQWMIEQCHKRGMELHAWINPFRAKTKGTNVLASNHIAMLHPERVFSYDNQLILNPGIPENRDYIYKIVQDIVSRYDIDGIHIDDYFYPYPVAGQQIPDSNQFRQHSNGFTNIADWRRDNVNIFIKGLCELIHKTKPWVKFGVSPFGIYRNLKNAANGSDTNGLQNYDDLYADVLMWVNNGWVDYTAPQLYWQIGHPTADYETLIKWWNLNASNRPLYIGEDIERTCKYADLHSPGSNQLMAKYKLHHEMNHVQGTVLWYSRLLADNYGNYASALHNNYWKYPALPPLMLFLDNKAPRKPRKMKPVWTSDGYILFWQAPKAKDWGDTTERYVVYRFGKNEKLNINDPSKIVCITSEPIFKLPYLNGKTKYIYVVTALDRVGNESHIAKKKVKL